MVGGLLRLIAAVAAGLGLAVAFAPTNAWYLAPVAVALFVWAVKDERWWQAAVWGLVMGSAYSVLTLHWLNPVGFDTVGMLSLLFGLWFAFLGFGIQRVWKLPFAPLWVACLWVLIEFLFSNFPLGGFSWLRLAFAQADGAFSVYASLVGVAGLTFVVAFTGASVTRILERLFNRQQDLSRARSLAGSLALTVLIVILVGSGFGLAKVNENPSTYGTLKVAAVQGGVPGTGLNSLGEKTAVIRNHVEATLKLAQGIAEGKVQQPDLVLWPENSTDIDPLKTPAVQSEIDAAADAIKAPILVGAVRTNDTNPVTLHNSAILWSPGTGAGQEYVKQHLVPFGEFMPMRDVIAGFTDRAQLVPSDFVAGEEPGVFVVDHARIGALICYEILSDWAVRGVAGDDIGFVVLQANNATYTHTGPGGLNESEQLLNISRIRAMEIGRAIMVATTNGITAAVEANGSVVEQLPPIDAGALMVDMPIHRGSSLAMKLSPYLEYGLALLGLVALGVGIVRRPAASADETVSAA